MITGRKVRDLTRELFEIYNTGDTSQVAQLVAPNWIGHDPAEESDRRGRAGYIEGVERYRHAFPDLHVVINELLTDGDRSCARWTARGTHNGELNGIAPTGRPVTIHGMELSYAKHHMVIETFQVWDALGLMVQLGVVDLEAVSQP